MIRSASPDFLDAAHPLRCPHTLLSFSLLTDQILAHGGPIVIPLRLLGQ
jgi:hypothetical protein